MVDQHFLDEAYRALADAMAGGPPVEFGPDAQIHFRPEARDVSRGGHPDAVAIVRTSGSTGTPKQTVLTGAGLRASAEATAEFLGGQGQWLIGLGLNFVAGLAMVSRTIQAGTHPVAMGSGPFSTEKLVDAAQQLSSDFTAVSLVPTQLARILDTDQPAETRAAGIEALRGFDAILVGGARLAEPVQRAALEAGLKIFTTYGMSETCGGCVYNATPLPGVDIDTVASSAGPRLRISGPMVTAGYLDDPELTAEHFGTHPADAEPHLAGRSWYLTDDLGRLTPGNPPILQVEGRVDDVINTGGVKVSAQKVQSVVEAHPQVREVFVGAADDPQWGQRVCAAVVTTHTPDAPELPSSLRTELSERIAQQLGSPAVPKTWVPLPSIPLLPNGKPDRAQLTDIFQRHFTSEK